MTDDKTRQLENRIDKLESTIEKMMPSRRDALKMGGAALVGGAAMSGTASAGTNQVGTIGSSPNDLVDIESEDINNADTVTTDTLDSTTVDNAGTVTTQDIVVNGTATGPFGGGGIVIESGDSITVERTLQAAADATMITLYSGVAKDVVGGTINGPGELDFYYEFSDNTILKQNGTGTSYSFGNASMGKDSNGGEFEVDFLPPAKDVIKIEIGGNTDSNTQFNGQVILKD